jgi:hypothetical protein
VLRNRSVSGAKSCLPFPVQVLPLHLVGIWLHVSNMWLPTRSKSPLPLILMRWGIYLCQNYTFKIERSRELAAHMILCHNYPFNIMEHEMFNKFCKSLNPLWKKVSRATIRKNCFTTYNIEKKKLKTFLEGWGWTRSTSPRICG